MKKLSTPWHIVSWLCRIIAAVILLQTLFFKFTGAAESVYIFTAMHLEPWGRIGTGVGELIASILLFVPRLTWCGAGLALGLMGGAIMSHLTVLGITVPGFNGGDGGELFALAVTVAVCSAVVLFLHRGEIPLVGGRLEKIFAENS